MSARWPLGPEVRRLAVAGGAMLYDTSRVSNLTAAWFDPQFWEDNGGLRGTARGRGTTHFIEVAGKHLVLRHYRRGGLVARFMADRYFWRGEEETRPFLEWQLSYQLHRAGLPVPAPVAARYRVHGRSYTGDLLTERLVDAISLAQALGHDVLAMPMWVAIGRCIRRFHDAGVCHADLNAHNVMLCPDESVYLIDFDRGRLRRPGLWCDSNVVRLRRSLEKISYGLPPERFTEDQWHALLDGYHQTSGALELVPPGA